MTPSFRLTLALITLGFALSACAAVEKTAPQQPPAAAARAQTTPPEDALAHLPRVAMQPPERALRDGLLPPTINLDDPDLRDGLNGPDAPGP